MDGERKALLVSGADEETEMQPLRAHHEGEEWQARQGPWEDAKAGAQRHKEASGSLVSKCLLPSTM